jgi:cyclopropane fatty-acyl-phospholipid synthase-like methyltransferase
VVAWWSDFFDDPGWQGVQLGWDSVEGERSAEQIDKIVRALPLEPGMRVLDAPCGTARIAIELAARGCDVTGIDRTARFLEEGRARAADRGLDVDLHQRDLREPVDDAGSFDAVICFWGSFGYFDEDGNRAQAEAAAAALKPGGSYLLDLPVTESIYPRFRSRNWFEAGETVVLSETAVSEGTGRIETTWTFLREGSPRSERRSSVRLYSLHELTELLRGAGFSSFEARDDELEPFALGSERLWLVATK